VQGGETEALKRLDKFMALQDWVCEFEKPKGNPAKFEPPATTVLSPYMKFGCLSCRLFWHRIQEVYAAGDGHTKPPTSLEGQLLWRECAASMRSSVMSCAAFGARLALLCSAGLQLTCDACQLLLASS
jgi:deoxyribodipyrimidine photolyase